MASSQEKATSGVLRNAAALLDEMQLMGETQGELFQTPLSLLLFCVSSLVQNFALPPSPFSRDASVVPPVLLPSGSKKVINSELWHACAGPLVVLPQRGSLVYYFPQGHSEQVRMGSEYSVSHLHTVPANVAAVDC
jgi:auxin response factor